MCAIKNLQVTIQITSENTFDVLFYEPESGDHMRYECHSDGTNILFENRLLAAEIRSWAELLKLEMEDAKNEDLD